MNQLGAETYQVRSYPEVSRFFDGLELVEPGVVACNEAPEPWPSMWWGRFLSTLFRTMPVDRRGPVAATAAGLVLWT